MYYEWRPYVPVAQRIAKANAYAKKQAKKQNRECAPVKVTGRKLATKFWGEAWCKNLDHYSDFANRLPRGRTYLGNGSVVDLQIQSGLVQAIVAGSDVYRVTIKIKTLPAKAWKAIQRDCAESIHSLLDLLQGRFDEGVMARIAQRDGGLFPTAREIEMRCSCPDYAGVCKHVAAVMYGVGVRLDASPELLFTLRNVDHSELIAKAVASESLDKALTGDAAQLADNDLGELFGIDLDVRPEERPKPVRKKRSTQRKRRSSASARADTANQSLRSRSRKAATGARGASLEKKKKAPSTK
jgi:uncharacterized Zn finger protein